MSPVPHQGSWEELSHTPPSLFPSPPPPQAPKSWEKSKELVPGLEKKKQKNTRELGSYICALLDYTAVRLQSLSSQRGFSALDLGSFHLEVTFAAVVGLRF